MEEDEIDLVDYIRVIWRRKILIVMGIIVCVAAGGVKSLRLPETYRVDTLIKIGKILEPSGIFDQSNALVLIDSVNNLIQIIVAENVAIGGSLQVEKKGTSMMRVTMEASDQKRAEKMLKKVVSSLISDHNRLAEDSVKPYRDHIKRIEASIKKLQKSVDGWKVELSTLYMGKNSETEDFISSSLSPNSLSALVRYLDGKIDGKIQRGLNKIAGLESAMLKNKMRIASVNQNKTKVIGGVRGTSIKPEKTRGVVIAGIVGLIMSLFLAFFIDFLGKARAAKKGMGHSV